MSTPVTIALENNSKLLSLGYNIPEHLPNIEDVSELKSQNSKSAAERAVVISYFTMLGSDWPVEKVVISLDDFRLTPALSKRERNLLKSTLAEQDKIDCTWLTECLQALSWCFGHSELSFDKYCDDDLVTKFPEAFTNPSAFIESATLRPFTEIYSMADLHYRYHWLSKDSQRQSIPLKLSISAISERRKALDWIIGTNQDWDSISMDT